MSAHVEIRSAKLDTGCKIDRDFLYSRRICDKATLYRVYPLALKITANHCCARNIPASVPSTLSFLTPRQFPIRSHAVEKNWLCTSELTFNADTNSETSSNVKPEMESTIVASFGDNGCSGVDGCSSRATRDA